MKNRCSFSANVCTIDVRRTIAPLMYGRMSILFFYRKCSIFEYYCRCVFIWIFFLLLADRAIYISRYEIFVRISAIFSKWFSDLEKIYGSVSQNTWTRTIWDKIFYFVERIDDGKKEKNKINMVIIIEFKMQWWACQQAEAKRIWMIITRTLAEAYEQCLFLSLFRTSNIF